MTGVIGREESMGGAPWAPMRRPLTEVLRATRHLGRVHGRGAVHTAPYPRGGKLAQIADFGEHKHAFTFVAANWMCPEHP